MRKWIEKEDWSEVSQEKSAHGKAMVLQSILLKKYHEFFPLKKRCVSSDDKPFFSEKLAILKRRKCREYRKNRRSKRWKNLKEL